MADQGTRGGTHEQHVKAGHQSHKKASSKDGKPHAAGTQGASHEQHAKAGQQSHKNS